MPGAPLATRRTRRATVLALLLAMSLLAGPAAAQEAEHDPTEPDRPVSSFQAQPRAGVSVEPVTFSPVPFNRVAGISRYQTAVEVSRTGWPSGSRHVVIAGGDTFPDALSATSLAGATRAPLLLATAAGIDTTTQAEIERLGAEVAHVVGDVPAGVAETLTGLVDEVREVRGGNVHDTSLAASRAAIAEGADPSTLILASAQSFADALTASALSAGLGHPMLLVGSEGFGQWVGSVSRQLGSTSVLVVGGEAVITDEVVSQVDGVTRLAGATRYGTALAVADHLRAAGLDGPPVVVSGKDFPDGLTAGVLAGRSHKAPLLLTDTGLDQGVAAWMDADATEWVRLVGGTDAVSSLVECQLRAGDLAAWLCIEEELRSQGYNTGEVDGQIDHQTVWMTYAFQKVAQLPVTGDFGQAEFAAMLTRPKLQPRRPDLEPDHMEVDIGRQLVLVVRDGEVVAQVHTSTGKASTPTVRGVYRVYEMRNYRQTHNHMYWPVFFHRGYAFHGYPEIPLYPASHGCARTYDGDMDFLWDYLYIGEQVATYL